MRDATSTTRRQGANARARWEEMRLRRRKRARMAVRLAFRSTLTLAVLTTLGAAGQVGFAEAERRGYTCLQEVRVIAAAETDPVEVARAAGLMRGIPMSDIDTDAAEARLMKDPWVLEARVSRSFPRRAVIGLRLASAAARTSDGLSGWDRYGRILSWSPRLSGAPILNAVPAGAPGATDSCPDVLRALRILDAMQREEPVLWRAMRSASPLLEGGLQIDVEGFPPRLALPADDWRTAVRRAELLRRTLGLDLMRFQKLDLRWGPHAVLIPFGGGA